MLWPLVYNRCYRTNGIQTVQTASVPVDALRYQVELALQDGTILIAGGDGWPVWTQTTYATAWLYMPAP